MFQKLFTPSTATAKQQPTDNTAAQKAKEGNKLPKAAGNSNFALEDLKNAHPLPSPGEIDPGRQSSLDSCAEATADSEEGELEEIKVFHFYPKFFKFFLFSNLNFFFIFPKLRFLIFFLNFFRNFFPI